MAIDSLRTKRWILLSGTLCNEKIFDDFLDRIGVEGVYRYSIPLKHPYPEDYLPELFELMRPGAVVCGFSLGALVAAHLADRLDAAALVLFSLNPYADAPAKKLGRLDLEAAVRAEGGRTALESRLGPIYGPAPLQTREHILSMADSAAEFIAEQTRLALGRPSAMSALAACRCPIRLLTGSRDTTTPLELAVVAAKTAMNGKALVLDGLGHYALLEDPGLCYITLKREGNL